jgi:membrane protease YdiL (CAAX protease family)
MSEPAKPRPLASRLLDSPLARIVIAIAIVMVPFILIQIPLREGPVRVGLEAIFPRPEVRQTVVLLFLSALVLTLYSAYVRWIEKRRVTELAARGALSECAAGLAGGAVLISASVGLLALLGGYEITGSNPWTIVIVPLATMILAGVLEETLFRGIVFRILEKSLGTWIALALSSVLFGALHLANPHASWISALAIMVEAGLLLGAAFLLTRRLWMCMGIHIAWNFGGASIYSVPISGEELKGLFTVAVHGPVWETGGAFGIEASVLSVLVCTAAGIVLLFLALGRGRVILPFWKRAPLAPVLA